MKIALLCVGKNEEKHLTEFIDHYINLGISTIYFGDNNDIGNDKQYIVLKPYINKGIVKYYNYQGIVDIQHKFYTDIYFKEKDNYDWYCVFDCDEFLDLKNKFRSIHEFLSQKEFDDTDSIFVKWEYRISENFPLYHKIDGPYKEIYTKPVYRYINDKIVTGLKSIFRYSPNIERVSLHYPLFFDTYKPIIKFGDNYQKINIISSSVNETITEINNNNISLVHYYFKSCDEYVDKSFRSRASTDASQYYYRIYDIEKLSKVYNYIIHPKNGFINYKRLKEEVQTYLIDCFTKKFNEYGLEIKNKT